MAAPTRRSAPLHRLGSDQWDKAKRRAAEKIHDVAAELLNIYAHREARVGQALVAPDAEYQRFADQFPFDVTPDQRRAIDEVIADLTSPKSMDRLICGDVGFGKTEVAMRAAFIAVQNQKQVGDSGADDPARAAAPREFQRPVRGLAGADRSDLAFAHRR